MAKSGRVEKGIEHKYESGWSLEEIKTPGIPTPNPALCLTPQSLELRTSKNFIARGMQRDNWTHTLPKTFDEQRPYEGFFVDLNRCQEGEGNADSLVINDKRVKTYSGENLSGKGSVEKRAAMRKEFTSFLQTELAIDERTCHLLLIHCNQLPISL